MYPLVKCQKIVKFLTVKYTQWLNVLPVSSPVLFVFESNVFDGVFSDGAVVRKGDCWDRGWSSVP